MTAETRTLDLSEHFNTFDKAVENQQRLITELGTDMKNQANRGERLTDFETRIAGLMLEQRIGMECVHDLWSLMMNVLTANQDILLTHEKAIALVIRNLDTKSDKRKPKGGK